MKKILYFCFLLCFLTIVLFAQEGTKPIITVLDFRISVVSKNEMKSIISLLSSTLFKTGKYTVIDVTERETLLKETEFSVGECADEACQIEIGKQLSAEMIVVGSLDKVGSKMVLSAKILDTATARTINTADGIYQDLDDLLENIFNFGKVLAGLTVKTPPKVGVIEEEERTPDFSVEKAYGNLEIEVKTAGTFYLAGIRRGSIPAGGTASLSDLEVGSHNLEIRYDDGEKESKRVTVLKDKTVRVVFSYIERPRLSEVFVLVEAGTFRMGSTGGDSHERQCVGVVLGLGRRLQFFFTNRSPRSFGGLLPG